MRGSRRISDSRRQFLGALLVHYNLQMRPFQRNGEHVKLLKTGENQRVQTGQVGLANRRIQPLCHLSGEYFQQFSMVFRFECCTFGALYQQKTVPSRES